MLQFIFHKHQNRKLKISVTNRGMAAEVFAYFTLPISWNFNKRQSIITLFATMMSRKAHVNEQHVIPCA